MNRVLLDTDTLSFFFKGYPKVTNRVDSYLAQAEQLSFSVVTYYEVLHGLYYRDARSQLARLDELMRLHQVLALTSNIARLAASITADLRRAGQPIGHNDVLIAATAISNGLTLVTNNTAHFGRITELELDNWAL